MRTNIIADELLMDYAAGTLPEPVALAVASHLSLNGEARAAYDRMNALGGALLDELAEAPLSEAALDAVLARLDEPEPPAPSAPKLDDETRELVPPPLRPYLPRPLSQLPWRRVITGVEECPIQIGRPRYKVALMRIEPGRAMPRHTHRGLEYTVVLHGAYSDDGGVRMERGDLCEADPADEHQPVADPEEGCLCLIVLDAPLKLSGWMGALVNPFLKH